MATRFRGELLPWDRQPQEVVWLNPDFPAIAGFIAGAGGTRNIALYPAEPSGASTGSNTYPSPGAGGIGVYSAGSANDGVKLHSIGNATNTVWEYPSARVSVAVFLRRIGNTGGNSPIFANLDPSASPFTAWGIVDASGTGTPEFQTSAGGAYTGLLSSAAFGDNEDVVIVGTYDGATMRIYRNGVLTGSTAKSGAIVYPNSAGRGPTVGNFWGGFVGRSFNGFIYGGLLSDIAWTDAEVRRISTLSGFWSAFEPQRIWIPVSAGGGTTITATLGTATASGHQATVNVNRTIAASLGTATASGFQATVQNSTDTTISATLGTATASGFAANVDANRTIAAGLGTATASGHQATVSNTNDTVINAGVGTAAASGYAASLNVNRTIAAALGTAQALGYAATVANGEQVESIGTRNRVRRGRFQDYDVPLPREDNTGTVPSDKVVEPIAREKVEPVRPSKLASKPATTLARKRQPPPAAPDAPAAPAKASKPAAPKKPQAPTAAAAPEPPAKPARPMMLSDILAAEDMTPAQQLEALKVLARLLGQSPTELRRSPRLALIRGRE